MKKRRHKTVQAIVYLWTDHLKPGQLKAWASGIVYLPTQPEHGIKGGKGSYFNGLGELPKALRQEAARVGLEVVGD